ncbi:MAG: ion channel [Reichenbachiella sp.]
MSESINDPGLGQKFDRIAERAINKDGQFNVKRINFPYTFKNTYQVLIRMDWILFFTLLTIFIIGSNMVFASFYFLVGKNELSGLFGNDEVDLYMQCLYFSFQSFTTVGFGTISPIGHWTSMISSIESVFGLISFAFVTGLLYGRFSRPNARFQYSKNALMTLHEDVNSFQFRFVNNRSSQIIELKANVIFSYTKEEKGKFVRKFFNLELESEEILFLPLNWTLVHKIDEASPLFNVSKEELEKGTAEIMILIKGFDDTFSQLVHSRYSYTWDEIVWGAKFVKPFYVDDQGQTILDSNLIDQYEKL